MARVLVVQDGSADRDRLVEMLRSDGHDVISEPQASAVDACAETNPDVAVVRIAPLSLEGIRTIAAISRLRPDIPLIGLSAINDRLRPLIRRTATALGASEVLFEPIDRRSLTTALVDLVGSPER